ncbi:EAL domain-containing protein [Chitinimonas sp.]|uniref:EAL domain-containing protein n=1 Tax=Chitinimonas sp. TaxID=1934313 RepID=UPI002F954053
MDFAIPFPANYQALLFAAFAMAMVHITQKLVEQASAMVGKTRRRAAFGRTAMCVGSLVWALDGSGLFMYAEINTDVARLAPAIASLLVMIVGARLTVPALTLTRSRSRVVLAALGLGLSMVLGHLILVSGFGMQPQQLNGLALLCSLLLTVLIGSGLALQHRAAKLQSLHAGFQPLPWWSKLLAAACIVLLHWQLVNILPNYQPYIGTSGDGVMLLLTLAAFGLLVGFDHLQHMRLEQSLQQAHAQALSLLRSHSLPDDADPAMQLSLLAERLPQLLQPQHLILHYQPIVHTDGRPAYFEALLRLRDDTLGAINPELFFLACELNQRSAEADRLVIARGLAQQGHWRETHGLRITITINVSPSTLLEPGFEAWLASTLREAGGQPAEIKLELTEHALIANPERLRAVIGSLRAHGIGVLMDDFGAGYSSLGLLADIPIEGIKCDRSLSQQLASDRRRQALLRHICKLAEELGLKVTVEGIETHADWQWIQHCSLSQAQGYFFARPMPADAIPAWLASLPSHRQPVIEDGHVAI